MEYMILYYLYNFHFFSLNIFYFMFQKDVSTDSFKVLTPMPNASHPLSYSLYINLKKIILLKLGFVFVIAYEPPWGDTCKKKTALSQVLS